MKHTLKSRARAQARNAFLLRCQFAIYVVGVAALSLYEHLKNGRPLDGIDYPGILFVVVIGGSFPYLMLAVVMKSVWRRQDRLHDERYASSPKR